MVFGYQLRPHRSFQSWELMRCAQLLQSCPTLCDPVDCSLPGSSRFLQARIQEWIAVPSSRSSSRPRDRTWVSCIAGRLFIAKTTREAPGSLYHKARILLSLLCPYLQFSLIPSEPTSGSTELCFSLTEEDRGLRQGWGQSLKLWWGMETEQGENMATRALSTETHFQFGFLFLLLFF